MMRHDRNEPTNEGELRTEVEQLRTKVQWQAQLLKMFKSSSANARAEAAEGERDEVAGRLSALLCDLTGGRLSKPTYDVPTMVQEIEEQLTRELEIDAEAEVERLLAEIRDRESERADLRDRVQKAEAQVARVEALPCHMVAAWLVGPKPGEERMTSVYAVRWDDVLAALEARHE